MDTSPTHGWVADQIGFSIAGVSLLRSGHRLPSISTMEVIDTVFGWPVADQIKDRKHYARSFEDKISAAYQRSLDDQSNQPVD